MAKKSVPPSITETAFECPHCGAFTTQYWYDLRANRAKEDHPLPFIPDDEHVNRVKQTHDIPEADRQVHLDWCSRMNRGLVFLETTDSEYSDYRAHNIFLSECYNCKKIAVWVHDSLTYPHEKSGVGPNTDLPEEIVKDFEEARDIVSLSPRGAAALLRLCIQKLCMHLGEKGKSIDDDIASLVSKGLNPLVQKSLDIVRVIGNEAVHPGVIDLSDDRDTANRLFDIVNSIADQMISHPKNVETLYSKLPEHKKKAIDNRNKKANT